MSFSDICKWCYSWLFTWFLETWSSKDSLWSNWNPNSFWLLLLVLPKFPIFILTVLFSQTNKWHLSASVFIKLSFNHLRIHWRLSVILKTSKNVYKVMLFWYVKVFVFWKCIQYTIHLDKTKMLKKIPSDKINGTKNTLFFLSRAPTHYSFTFNFRFLYGLKDKVCSSKTVRRIFHFGFRFVFMKVYIFVQQNAWDFWL